MQPSRLDKALIAAARAHRRRAADALAPLGLHPGQELLLSILARRGPTTQAALARILAVEPPTTAKMVSRLDAGGFTMRSPDPSDARAKLVALTDHGAVAAAKVEGVWAELGALTASALTETEAAELTRLLLLVANRLRDDESPVALESGPGLGTPPGT